MLLDKTATLTEGKPSVTDVETFGAEKEWVLKIASGIEKNSNHPLAKCLVDYAAEGVGKLRVYGWLRRESRIRR